METTERARPRSWRGRWSTALAAVVAVSALPLVAPPPASAAPLDASALAGLSLAVPAAEDSNREVAVVLRTWQVVPPQPANCFHDGTPPVGGPDAYYDNTLAPVCGSYYYTDYITSEGQRYRKIYQHISGWSYIWYGDQDPPPPTKVPKDKVKEPEPPITVGTTPSKPEDYSGAIIGKWRIKPTKAGQWYGNNVMAVGKGGYGALTDREKDPCNWKVGDPTYRNLKGHGPTWTGERYLGPCVQWQQAWVPVTVTVSSDGRTLTENVAGRAPLTWLRTDVGLDCGARGSLTWEQLRMLHKAAPDLEPGYQDAFFADPCSWFNVGYETSEVVLTDDGTDTGAVASAKSAAGKTVPCKKAVFTVKLRTQVSAQVSVPMASYDMATRFCYDGKKVWKPGKQGFAPEAVVENVNITGWGKAYQMAYMQGVTGTTGFIGDDQKTAETTITTQWNGGLPIVKWAWPENDFLTATLRVYAHGSAIGRMGS